MLSPFSTKIQNALNNMKGNLVCTYQIMGQLSVLRNMSMNIPFPSSKFSDYKEEINQQKVIGFSSDLILARCQIQLQQSWSP